MTTDSGTHGTDELADALIAPWRNGISWARTEEDLAAVANSFLAEWSGERLAQLPPGFRPRRIESSTDLVLWAMQFETPAETPREEGLAWRQMALFFRAAYRRLIEVSRETLDA